MVTGARAAFPASYGMRAGIEGGGERGGTGSSGRAEGGEAEDPGAGAGAKAESRGAPASPQEQPSRPQVAAAAGGPGHRTGAGVYLGYYLATLSRLSLIFNCTIFAFFIAAIRTIILLLKKSKKCLTTAST